MISGFTESHPDDDENQCNPWGGPQHDSDIADDEYTYAALEHLGFMRSQSPNMYPEHFGMMNDDSDECLSVNSLGMHTSRISDDTEPYRSINSLDEVESIFTSDEAEVLDFHEYLCPTEPNKQQVPQQVHSLIIQQPKIAA
ncbi:hypothetical protein BT96DRAFT_992736 [Gymnopus androsaceus JB14]|uniref:Uncharacterized protein n=1 Tax=Gymnopus androsaceus JB14 TaxID=1447944 RepID=A0A6A4HST7_9AGAR|nr:hypothetical protein BT96DRAFT_992736 [Gymnopus androsaceus JB14]